MDHEESTVANCGAGWGWLACWCGQAYTPSIRASVDSEMGEIQIDGWMEILQQVW